ncbi:hypothetical protein [Pseudomonas viridiflava]|uniref:hypothetical protein n=1 Tax=Pseudomonas viridiflava TaxID=33069 RepID=UPI000EFD8FC5|nr:hypothetical protein [Pseudomonas viridiflava]
MKASKTIFSALLISAALAGPVLAGPAVTVTVKNLGTATANYKVLTNNEAITKVATNPTPRDSIPVGEIDVYNVQNNQSQLVTFANLRYTIGGKTCVFLATYVSTAGPLGSSVPKWNNTATPSGGATCTAKVTSTNFSTYEWAVEFTMK